MFKDTHQPEHPRKNHEAEGIVRSSSTNVKITNADHGNLPQLEICDPPCLDVPESVKDDIPTDLANYRCTYLNICSSYLKSNGTKANDGHLQLSARHLWSACSTLFCTTELAKLYAASGTRGKGETSETSETSSSKTGTPNQIPWLPVWQGAVMITKECTNADRSISIIFERFKS